MKYTIGTQITFKQIIISSSNGHRKAIAATLQGVILL